MCIVLLTKAMTLKNVAERKLSEKVLKSALKMRKILITEK